MKDNILIVVNSLKLGGGAERIASQLGSNLKERGYNVYFLARYDRDQIYEYDGEYSYLFETKNKNKLTKTFREMKTPKKIAKICKKRDINSVISFSTLPNYCSILSKLFFNNKSNIIICIRNNPLRYYDGLNLFVSKKLYSKADKVVVQTKRIGNILENNFSIKNTSIIPNFVNLEKYKILSNERIKQEHKEFFRNNKFKYISIGRLNYQKGQSHLVRSFKEVLNKEKNCKLAIIGEGFLKSKLKDLVKKMGIIEKVLFSGKVTNVFPYLKKADAFTLTSYYEGFPNVVLEALSQDLPVISTDCISGPREILAPELKNNENPIYPYYGKFGVLSKVFNKKQNFNTLEEEELSNEEKLFSKAMIRLMNENNLKVKYSNISKRAEDFTTEKIMDKWINLL